MHGHHVGIEDEKLVNLGRLAGLAWLQHTRGHGIVAAMVAVFQLLAGIDGTAGTDQGIACPQAQPKPRHGTLGAGGGVAIVVLAQIWQLVNGAEPEGEAAQLDCGWIEIHAVDIPRGDVVHDAPQLLLIAGRVDALADLLLFQLQIFFGELACGLQQVGTGAHGHLAEFEIEDAVGIGGCEVFEQLPQSLTHQALG